MARHAPAGGDHGARGDDAVEILGRRLRAHEDDGIARGGALLGDVGIEDGNAARGAGARRQAGGEWRGVHGRLDHRVQQLVELLGEHAADGVDARDQALGDHVIGNADGGSRGPFTRSRLQQVQRAALDGELDVLHVAEVALKSLLHPYELGVRARQAHRHLIDVKRRADPGDDVLALRVEQELAVEALVARRRIPGERDAGAGRVAAVAEDHRLHGDRRAEALADRVHASVVDGFLEQPRLPHGLDRAPQLRRGIGREVDAECRANEMLVFVDQRAERRLRQLGVGADALVQPFGGEQVFEIGARHTEHDVAVHLQKAAV